MSGCAEAAWAAGNSVGVASLWAMIEFLGAAAITQEPVQLEGRSDVGRDQEVDEHGGGDTVMGRDGRRGALS